MTNERYESFEDAGIILPPNASGEVDTQCPECSGSRKKSREQCLSVNVDEGVWKCHHCGWADRLWLPEHPALVRTRPHKLTVRKPQPPPDELHPAAIRWFHEERAIPAAVLRANGVTADEQEVRFPYYVNGELINVKYRSFPDKRHRMEKGADVAFFNLDRVGQSESLILTEGELDALAIQAATGDCAVISVPTGVNSKLDRCFANAGDTFERVGRVTLAGDMDEAGQKLTDELARRIGRETCLTVAWPPGCKDANDTLSTWGAEMVATCLAEATPYPIEGLIRFGDFTERMLALRTIGSRQGIEPPWPRFADCYRVEPGQLTIVTGTPGSGKSTWLDNLLLHLARAHDWHFAICSPENWPGELHLANLVQQYVGKSLYPQHSLNGSGPKPMSEVEARDAAAWIDRHFEIVHPHPMRMDDVLALSRTLIRRNGVTGVVLDPWNRLGHNRGNKGETDYISEQLAEVKEFANKHGVHVWIVAHPTKMRTQWDARQSKFVTPRVRPYDVSGSHAWSDMADMILCVHRDRDAGETSVFVDKVRFRTHGELGEGRFRFDRRTGGYEER